MGRNKLLTSFGFVLCCMLLSASSVSAQGHSSGAELEREHPRSGGPPGAVYWFCSAAQRTLTERQTVSISANYYSGVFKGTADTARPEAVFLQFLEQKYSFNSKLSQPGDIQCGYQPTEAEANKAEQGNMKRAQDLNQKTIETGWVYSGVGSAGAAPSAPAQPTTTQPTPQTARPQVAAPQPNGSAVAPLATAAQTAPAPTSLTGTWSMSIGKSQGTVTIKQDGNKITGTVTLNEDSKAWPLEGTVDANKLHFTAKRSDGVVEDYTAAIKEGGNYMDGGVRTDSDKRIVGESWEANRAANSTGYGSQPPAALSPTPAPAASAPPPAANTPAPAAAAQVARAPGTAVEVRMIDTVDSSRDPAGKQYRATVTQTVNAGSVTIQQGTVATVTLARNGANWVAQLSSLMINGQAVAVASRSATVITTTTGITTAQNTAGTVSNTVGGIFGRKPNVPPPAPPVATGDRVILPPGSRLSFVLTATP